MIEGLSVFQQAGSQAASSPNVWSLILGALIPAVIGMLDRDVHSQLAPFADKIFVLDVRMSEAIVDEENAPGSQLNQLRTCYEDAVELELDFRQGVSELFQYDKSEPAQPAVERDE